MDSSILSKTWMAKETAVSLDTALRYPRMENTKAAQYLIKNKLMEQPVQVNGDNNAVDGETGYNRPLVTDCAKKFFVEYQNCRWSNRHRRCGETDDVEEKRRPLEADRKWRSEADRN
ncbi:hypothetical protein L2E82_10228 [Cichorium intybus]|uniref:Uncharacterized protein n=1 Tax=Cichorium intybus TaxID=13427 RepID=A0ACB9GB12_CICIN|nr:hypothetical protein L2E82_10228 [Cichorium intybus]